MTLWNEYVLFQKCVAGAPLFHKKNIRGFDHFVLFPFVYKHFPFAKNRTCLLASGPGIVLCHQSLNS